MKTVCEECKGDLRMVADFKTKVPSWHEVLNTWITIFQCKKCKNIYVKED